MAKTNYDSHNCNRLMQLVNLSLDGGLTPDEEQHFLHEINTCSHCLSKYKIEKSFIDFLRNKVEKKQVNQSCIDSIKLKIQTGV
jgi:hypothetical protein